MSAEPALDQTVALFFRLVVEPRPAGAAASAADPGQQLRLGWAIYAGGSPVLTLDCRLPPGDEGASR